VADALDYAHNQGVFHRDIKPPNLLLDARGNVWVTDFGLAKFEEGADLSQSHELVGTLRFMAPERFRGVTDRRVDIYAIGATLYEMLTLRPAFAARDQIQLIDQITHQPPVPLRQHDRRIPRDLETIVLKVLAKDPKDRCAKAGELRDELRRFVEGRPTRWRRVGAAEQFRRWCKRNPALATVSVTAVALTAILALSSTIAAWIYRDQRNRLANEQGKTQKAERQAILELGKSLQAEGAALQRTGLAGQRYTSLDLHTNAAQVLATDPDGKKALPSIRNHAIAALGLTDLRVRQQRDCGDIYQFTVDGPLERYAVIEKSGAVVLRRWDDDRDLVRLPGPDQRSLVFAWSVLSPDGELVVTDYVLGSGGDLIRVRHLGRRELLGSLMSRAGLQLHPDGRRLVFGTPVGHVGVWDCVKNRVVRRLPLDFTSRYFSLDPEGRRLAVNSSDRARRGLQSSISKPVACWPTGGRALPMVPWRGAPTDSCLRSAVEATTRASTTGTSAERLWLQCSMDTPATSSLPASRTRVTCWRPRAGTAPPGCGMRPPGSRWR